MLGAPFVGGAVLGCSQAARKRPTATNNGINVILFIRSASYHCEIFYDVTVAHGVNSVLLLD